MSKLSRVSERIARDWLCASQGDPATAPLRYAARVLLEEAEAEAERLLKEAIEAREVIRKDYNSYYPTHPYAVDLLKRYPWLAAEAAGKE